MLHTVISIGALGSALVATGEAPCATVVPLPIPRTAVVAIASSEPFHDFAWSFILKVGFTAWVVR